MDFEKFKTIKNNNRKLMTTQLPEPNFIDRDPDTITKEWVELYEKKSGKVLQPAQIERLMIENFILQR